MIYGLREWAACAPDRIALEFETLPPVSYAELEARANRYAQLFRHLGLRRGDHICAVLPNGLDVIATAWGAWRAGLYHTPVAHSFTAHEIAHVVRDSHSLLVIGDSRFAARLAPLRKDCPRVAHWLALDGAHPALGWPDLEAALAAQPDTPIPDESPGALMLYSSGTTGAPKGIWRPLPPEGSASGGIPGFARDLIEIFDFDADTRFLSPAPLYHAAPLRFSLALTTCGGTAVIMDRFDAERALDLLEQRDITLSQWVPTMFRRLLALPEARRRAFHAPRHRICLHSAAPCPPALKRQMLDWWGPILTEYYSGTESVGMTRLDSAEWLAHPGSVGRAVKGRLHILDAEGRELPPGQTGTVYFDPPSPFCYFNDPVKTAGKTSAEGWQTFGEVGHVDTEGYLYLTDRNEDMIISGGVNLYPQEIEQAIERLAEVAECSVAPIPDEDFGERPVAFVQPGPDAPPPEELIALVAAHCREWLGSTKQPCQIRIVADLPRSEAGKTLRRVLRERLAAEVATEAAPANKYA